MVLEFGVDLAKIGTTIQESIRDQILAMTGNHAKTIDVVIDDIKMDSGDKDSEEEKIGHLLRRVITVNARTSKKLLALDN